MNASELIALGDAQCPECQHLIYTPGYVRGDCPACDNRAFIDMACQIERFRALRWIKTLNRLHGVGSEP